MLKAKEQGPATATRFWLKEPSGEESPITLSGKRVISGEGVDRKIQAFPSFDEAKDYFERVTFLKQKEGFVVTRKEEVPRDLAVESQEAFPPDGFDGEIKRENGLWAITFEGDDKVPAPVCAALVRRVQLEGPRAVQLICDFAIPGKAWEKALRGARLETVQAFIFDTHFQTTTRQSRNSIGDLAAVLTACPNLHRFFATGKLALSPVSHDNLRELHLLGCPLKPELALALAQCEFPSLERLVLSVGSEDGPGADDKVLQALSLLHAPALREVHLSYLEDTPSFLDALLSRGIPSHWKTLTLAGASIADTGSSSHAPILKKHAAALRTLEAVGVPLKDEEEEVPEIVSDAEDWKDMFLPEAYRTW